MFSLRYFLGFLSIFLIALEKGFEQASAIRYPFTVEVIDLAQATCLFFLSVLGVANMAKGLAPDKTNVVNT